MCCQDCETQTELRRYKSSETDRQTLAGLVSLHHLLTVRKTQNNSSLILEVDSPQPVRQEIVKTKCVSTENLD